MLIEGVEYHKFRVSYTLADGMRRRMVRWSPGYPWVREEIARELVERFGLDGIKAGSVTIRSADTTKARREQACTCGQCPDGAIECGSVE